MGGPVLLWIGAAAAAAALAFCYGCHEGAAEVQARWDEAKAEEREKAEADRESNRLRSQAAQVDYEARRAAIARRASNPSPESRYALHATICPARGPLGRTLELGDVPIDRSILDRLRAAGAD